MRWFRLYTELLDDPKVQRLAPQLFKHWINLLCLTSRNDGMLPSIADIAFALRISDDEAEQALLELFQAGLLDGHDNHKISPHNWKKWQYASDSSTERVARHRKKRTKAPAAGSGEKSAAPTIISELKPVFPAMGSDEDTSPQGRAAREARQKEKEARFMAAIAQVEIPQRLQSPPFREWWNKWMHRRFLHKAGEPPTGWLVYFREQLADLGMGTPDEAMYRVRQAAINGYQGLASPRQNSGGWSGSRIDVYNVNNGYRRKED